MVLGIAIAIGGAVLYAPPPNIMQKAVLEGGEAIIFPRITACQYSKSNLEQDGLYYVPYQKKKIRTR